MQGSQWRQDEHMTYPDLMDAPREYPVARTDPPRPLSMLIPELNEGMQVRPTSAAMENLGQMHRWEQEGPVARAWPEPMSPRRTPGYYERASNAVHGLLTDVIPGTSVVDASGVGGPSLSQNLQSGEYRSAGLQTLGLLSDGLMAVAMVNPTSRIGLAVKALAMEAGGASLTAEAGTNVHDALVDRDGRSSQYYDPRASLIPYSGPLEEPYR
jgi:hypothetical protein